MEEGLLKDADRLMRVHRHGRLCLTRFLRRALSGKGLTVPQYTLLAVLDELGESTMAVLAEALAITMGAVTPLVDKMLSFGYVTRERSTEDRRRVTARLTPQGRKVLESFLDQSRERIARTLSDINPEALAIFLETYEKVIAGFSAIACEGPESER